MAKNGRVVVTGGAGFIGLHLVDGLLERAYRVTIIDDLGPWLRRQLSEGKPRRFPSRPVAIFPDRKGSATPRWYR